MAFKSLKVVVH